MNEYINNWLTIIENMKTDNTYKLAWGRAIIECVKFEKYSFDEENKVAIEFEEIAKCMLRYYWNQLFFFNLKQSPYTTKEPEICQYAKKLMDEYIKITNSVIPVWYDKAITVIIKQNDKLYKRIINNVISTLHKNVCYRFKNVSGKALEIYEYHDKNDSRVYFNVNDIDMLKEYGVVLSKLLNYKWAQLLEKYNHSPKIINKVNGISDTKIERGKLKKYEEILLKQFNDGKAIDFYTGDIINENEITVDHVIPWSFMYSNDIWNLVLTSRSNNSSKSNSIPSQEIIDKLKKRNEKLLTILDGKYRDEIELSIQNGYVDKFYFDCKL